MTAEEEKRIDPDGYAAANLFVGKYSVPDDGHIALGDGVRIRYMRKVGGHMWIDDAEFTGDVTTAQLWLIIEDGDFWPVMINISSLMNRALDGDEA
jgi:hypothetical protein